eukprot:TRINITY_DN2119_c1_g1_i1.p1 TRINITY_DN2119_c1_g1~~TRINITY_DN2119_c1_g1_i1.p1  ORF type:complete len:232 (-),score=22.37 TRINITY_DN2119_c1_g1_i1:23-718(-)
MAKQQIQREHVARTLPAAFFLVAKPLEEILSRTAQPLPDDFVRAAEHWTELKHWAILVKFQDCENKASIFRMCELEPEDTSELLGGRSCRKIIRSIYSSLNLRSEHELQMWLSHNSWTFVWQAPHAIRMSPIHVKRLCDNNPLNGKSFHPVSANCQEWVRELLRTVPLCVQCLSWWISGLPPTLGDIGLPALGRRLIDSKPAGILIYSPVVQFLRFGLRAILLSLLHGARS